MTANALRILAIAAALFQVGFVVVNRLTDRHRPLASGGSAILAGTGQGAGVGLRLEIGEHGFLVGLLIVVRIGKSLGPLRTALQNAYDPPPIRFEAAVAQPTPGADALVVGLPTRSES